jgi:fatty acid synthase
VQSGLDKNEIVPLNIDRVYDYDKLDEAIRYMGGGNHMGKIVIRMPRGCKTESVKLEMPLQVKSQFNTSGIHLITGGMGGFGMELAEWLIGRGATKVLLMGRTGITSLYQTQKFAKYKGILEYVKGDITSETDVAHVFLDYKINGVWHLAMKLNDQLYTNLTDKTWKETIDVKERGAYLLDKYCPQNATFVCWSSISSLFGNAGQTNYAHGNNMMELICRDRRTAGNHGLSICWGAIDNIGYLSQENSKINKLMFLPQNIDDCLNDLHTLMASQSAVVSCYKVNREFNTNTEKNETLLDSIMSIIGITSIDTIDKNTTLTDLGMDSLQSASVKSVLKKFGKDVKPAEVLKLKISDLM